MIQDNDNIVLNKEDEIIREHSIANLLYEFIEGGNFVWSWHQDISNKDDLSLSILYKGEALCTAVNEDIFNRILMMSKKMPAGLRVFYNYTAYDLTTSFNGSVNNKPVRSGFDISIKANKYADFDFKLRFKLLSERTVDSVHYDGRFCMRFIEADESTKRIVELINTHINYNRPQ